MTSHVVLGLIPVVLLHVSHVRVEREQKHEILSHLQLTEILVWRGL
jgi:hypothetical protein